MEPTENTYEIPVTIVVQSIDSIVTDDGVTSAATLLIATVDGTLRRFVFTTDDLEILASLITDTLAESRDA